MTLHGIPEERFPELPTRMLVCVFHIFLFSLFHCRCSVLAHHGFDSRQEKRWGPSIVDNFLWDLQDALLGWAHDRQLCPQWGAPQGLCSLDFNGQ